MEFDGSILVPCKPKVKPAKEAKRRQWMTLHCEECNIVLGDSRGICGEIKCLDSIMCLKVTDNVVVGDAVELRHKGDLANCIYSPLKCRGCRSAVGKVIHSAPPRLDMVRSIFLLSKANICCYILNSSSMVHATTLTFDMKAFREKMDETKQQFAATMDRMKHIKSRLTNRSGTSDIDKLTKWVQKQS